MDDNFSLFFAPKQSLERGGGLSLPLRRLFHHWFDPFV